MTAPRAFLVAVLFAGGGCPAGLPGLAPANEAPGTATETPGSSRRSPTAA